MRHPTGFSLGLSNDGLVLFDLFLLFFPQNRFCAVAFSALEAQVNEEERNFVPKTVKWRKTMEPFLAVLSLKFLGKTLISVNFSRHPKGIMQKKGGVRFIGTIFVVFFSESSV